jgi:hypothetical protein
MKTIARTLFSLIAGLAGLPAGAVSIGTDYSDLWWNADENGWGMNVIQQQDVLFITLFIYGADGRPTWVVGPATTLTGTNGAGDSTFTGLLYTTTGTPYNSLPYNPNAVAATEVGSVTFTGRAAGGASVSYVINGFTSNKSLVRQTWRAVAVTGDYLGALNSTNSNCLQATDNGPDNTSFNIHLTISATTLTLQAAVGNETTGGGAQQCTFTGPYSQVGRMGQAGGAFSCTGAQPDSGTFTLTELQVSPESISARISGRSQSCDFNGRIGGVREF